MRITNSFVLILVLLCISCSTTTAHKILFVSNAKVDCEGVGPQKCFQIKDVDQTVWTLFYDQIESFQYEEGFFYKIKVEVSEVENPAADQSALKYKLIEVLEKSTIPLNLDSGSWLVTQIKDQTYFGRNPFIKIDLSKDEISGNTSCNRFSAKIGVKHHSVSISELSSTKMMCRDIDVEDAFLKALQEVASYTLMDGKLQLLGDNKDVLMTCKYLKSE